ncbi:pyrophosphatase PpaX [Salicibibacter halophilus]|uniref:Pyrophosphatase PpaX n=1 Tax=Salicibibacter halophilus TaxID=2502791 RepID=A0A514LK05_9BACI|nr:pyrophosphatase PpaX [Salicibibacter halophilus]QDI91865.1 pyrophosphatase PpaX [Salicibibacter halophilus]
MDNVNTVLFDLDGTLIDTNDLIISSFVHTLEHYYPGRFEREDILDFIGPSLADTFHSLDAERADEMMTMYREHNHARHDELIKEYTGVRETLEQLAAASFQLGVVTTKRGETAWKGLDLMGMKPFFKTVVTLDEVENPKPHPEPLEKAMKALGATAEETLMVGDNVHDIEGGKNAGTRTAAVAWSIKGVDVLKEHKPDVILDDMRDLLDILGVSGQ